MLAFVFLASYVTRQITSRSNAQFFYSAGQSKLKENNLSRAERTKNTDPKKQGWQEPRYLTRSIQTYL